MTINYPVYIFAALCAAVLVVAWGQKTKKYGETCSQNRECDNSAPFCQVYLRDWSTFSYKNGNHKRSLPSPLAVSIPYVGYSPSVSRLHTHTQGAWAQQGAAIHQNSMYSNRRLAASAPNAQRTAIAVLESTARSTKTAKAKGKSLATASINLHSDCFSLAFLCFY